MSQDQTDHRADPQNAEAVAQVPPQVQPKQAFLSGSAATACRPSGHAGLFWMPVWAPFASFYCPMAPFAWGWPTPWPVFQAAAAQTRQEAEKSARREQWLRRLEPGLN